MNAPHFVCPFCGLLCDDLPFPGTSGLLQTACPKAAEGWAAIRATGDARVDGVAVAEAAAVRAASAALAKARRPLIGGLAGDVQMMRAALALADRCGARVVHANQAAAQRNLFALQSRGAVATTLAEARQRADLVVVVGGDVTRRFPRIMERLFAPAPVFVDAAQRRLALLGVDALEYAPAGVSAERVDCGGLDLFDAVGALRACCEDRIDARMAPAGLAALAERMLSCRYGLLLWAAVDSDFAGADPLVEQLQQLLQDLNRETRWAALPLAGSGGDLTANAVAAWQTGFALPLEFRDGEVAGDAFPDYSDVDLLLWLAVLPGLTFPDWARDVPVVAIGAPGLAPPGARVFIPAAVPGVEAAGHLVRTDGVVTLYAPAQTASAHPAAATQLERIAAALEPPC
ncbi:MAG: hypothetical protein IPF74_00265 [Rhodocyclaceae bacterium]|nr:hypothetical protein [Rhodocyclaceae bacterium]